MNAQRQSFDWKEFVFKKGEKLLSKASTPLPYKELAWKAVNYAVKCGQSDPLSFALRPIADHKHLKRWIGLNLATLALVAAVWAPMPGLASDTGGVPMLVIPEGETKLTTQEAIRWPIPSREISQGFWLLHGGIDIRTPEGTQVHPVMAGRVVETEDGKFGYGQKIVVGHEKGYKSLYAHMSATYVKVGDRVTTESILGRSGNTGRSTGPHLHLEIHVDNKPINPLSVLGNK